MAAAQGGAAPPSLATPAPAPVAPAADGAPAAPAALPAPFAGPVAGAWVAEGWWTAGLAAWRVGDCARAGDAFATAANATQNAELAAAALYWQARAAVRCRHPNLAAEPLKAAAARDETLYGMLAAEQLGLHLPPSHAQPDFTSADWQALRDLGNVRTVVALAEIGEDGLADDVLRHQARIGDPALYPPLARLARDLGLPGTQLWMASNVPGGAAPLPAGRYPTPKWTPANGWQVDPALVYAHTLQESLFRTRAVSPAGARGLMQIMPAAARDHAAEVGVTGNAADLARPEVNLAFGQNHLAMLRAAPGTQGLLPKVVAAYNAGLQPVTRWNSQIRDQGDPLLWIESVPYWETRGYVAAVLRNYWMYERQAGGVSESRVALAQGAWPEFPGLGAARALRVGPNRVSWVESPGEKNDGD
ncbi:MAG: lytic transglycosylase domain-containing protein [Proteobacteria bacterium]|nr:lytic transglycosylase domain-containing protein [Pseudomonadota bacterium]